MDFNYLKYLAKIGRTNIHPYEKAATNLLIRELDLRDGQRVLELGCGTGGTLVRISGRYHLHLYGLDQLDEMLKTAAQRLRLTNLARRTSLLKGSISALPFPNAAFDRLYAESVIGIVDPRTVEAALDEAYRVLKDRGILILNDAVWKKTTTAEQAQTINQASITDFGLPLASQLPWHEDDWLNLFQAHGFHAQSILIADALQSVGEPAKTPPELISQALSTAYKIIGHLNPNLRRQKQAYNHLLEKHRSDGRCIEPRLFILSKP